MLQEVSIEEQAFNAENQLFGDDRLGVMFYMRVVEDPERTLAEGRKCFTDTEYVKVMIPGDRNPALDQPVQHTGNIVTDYSLRFAKQYARFKANVAQVPDGTPLSLWPQMPASLAEELKFINVHTVEQLAELADNYVHKLPMGHQWKDKARSFVKAMSDGAVNNKLQLELAERDNRIDTLEKAIREQAAQIATMMQDQQSAKSPRR